jgi:hypothetical protein
MLMREGGRKYGKEPVKGTGNIFLWMPMANLE